MPFHIACTASAGKKSPADLWRWLQTGLLFFLALHGLQEAFAQQTRDRSIIKQGYFSTFRFLHSGQYELARKGFEQATRRGIKAGAVRFIDSICYYTMEGEVAYRQGRLAEALGYFRSALQLYNQHSGWMLHVKFPSNIAEKQANRRLPAWAHTKRQIRLGSFPERFNFLRSGGGLVPGQVGGGGQLQPLHVDELVRCIALAIRRYAELLGPLAKQDPLAQQVLENLTQRQGPPNHWSEIWLDLPLGVAYAAVGKNEMAVGTLKRSLLAGGRMDHPLTGLAMLTLGRISLENGNYDEAIKWLQEAALSAFYYDRAEVIEEAFQLLFLAQSSSGRGGIPPTLSAATAWAKQKKYEEMYTSLLAKTAEAYAVGGNLKLASSTLSLVRRAIGRSDMAKARIGAEINYVGSVIAYMQGDVKDGYQSLQAAIEFERKGSVRLFHIKLVDSEYVRGAIRDRGAMKLYEQVLDDPVAIVWRQQPLEALSQLLVPQPLALNHWFYAALKREKPLVALNIVDRMKRARFYSQLPLGGRLLNLCWIMQGPLSTLSQEAQLQRREFSAQFPTFEKLVQQADNIREKLKDNPLLSEDPDLAKTQKSLLTRLAKNSKLQNDELLKMAVRREPVAMIFPPLRDVEKLQQNLGTGEAILVFHTTQEAHHVFLLTQERHRHWKIASPKNVLEHLKTLYRLMGHHDSNRALDLDHFADKSWQEASKQLAQEITSGAKVDLGRDIKELVIVPDHFYWYVPFEALWVGPKKPRALLTKTRIRYAPTLGLTETDNRGRPQSGNYAIVRGQLYPGEDSAISEQAFQQIQKVVPRGHAITDSLPGRSNLLATLFDGLIVLDDLEPSGKGPLSLAPFRIDEGKPGSNIQTWLSLPWGSPDVIVLPGFHTPAENSLKHIKKLGRAGDELFYTSMALLASGSRTILLSRWRTGGQTSTDLIREFVQELPDTTAQDAWQRAVQLTQITPIELALEPRVKPNKDGLEITAEHPFFWSGYIVIDPGIQFQDKKQQQPELEFPKK